MAATTEARRARRHRKSLVREAAAAAPGRKARDDDDRTDTQSLADPELLPFGCPCILAGQPRWVNPDGSTCRSMGPRWHDRARLEWRSPSEPSQPDHECARHPFRRPSRSRSADAGHRRLRGRLPDRLDGGLRHRALHAARFTGHGDAGDEVSRMRQASGPLGAGRYVAGRRARAGHQPRARSGAGGLRHRRADPLAGLQ